MEVQIGTCLSWGGGEHLPLCWLHGGADLQLLALGEEGGGAILHLWLLWGGASWHLLVLGCRCQIALVVVVRRWRFALASVGLEVQ